MSEQKETVLSPERSIGFRETKFRWYPETREVKDLNDADRLELNAAEQDIHTKRAEYLRLFKLLEAQQDLVNEAEDHLVYVRRKLRLDHSYEFSTDV